YFITSNKNWCTLARNDWCTMPRNGWCSMGRNIHRKLFSSAESNLSGKPKYLTWDELWEHASPKFKDSANLDYDKIMKLFTTTDLKGYRQDERFANMIDDALHCFYAAHCDYFITIDKRCADKARLVYEKLGISTAVYSPDQFYAYASSLASIE
ncbi:hypothetical protein, partial [Pedobacter sp. Leaf216]|uniref:hypothetical protein n=1 Tax=Pedobacter sp. Leaf216 TaxID=1735684 RepID=UPI000AD713A6